MAQPATDGSSLERVRLAARQLFITRGYQNTRPQDIARLAGVANGTFYLHFRDKQAAFLDFAQNAQSELNENLLGRLEQVDDVRQRWQIVLETVIDFGRRQPGVLNAAFLDPVLLAPESEEAWRIYDKVGELVKTVMGQGQGQVKGQLDRGFDTEMISHGICGMLRSSFLYAWRKEMDVEDMVRQLSLFIDRGLALPATQDQGVAP